MPLRLCKPASEKFNSKLKIQSRPASARPVWTNEEDTFSFDDGHPVRPSPSLCWLIISILLRVRKLFSCCSRSEPSFV